MSQSDKVSMKDLCNSGEVDLIVFGGGAGGMTAALIGKLEGLDVILCEKTDQVGGITATSGGTTWVPGTSLSERDGVPDRIDDARQFLKCVVGQRGGEDIRDAFLESGRAAIAELETKTDVKFVAAKAHPDYVAGPGSAFGGRALAPIGFDGRLLGKDFARIRPPRPEFMGLGGMMVGRDELTAILNRFKSFANFKTTMKIVLRYFKDRLSYPRGTRIMMGNALVARLFYSLKNHQVPVAFNTPLKELLLEDGKVIGARVDSPEGERVIRARRGVVLATGGIAWNKKLREMLYPQGTRDCCLAPPSNSGDGVSCGIKAGARLDNGHDSAALWMPCSSYKRPNGKLAVWPHIILDRAKPGLLAVNAEGQRFVNESNSYHDFCMGEIAANKTAKSIPAWLIVDEAFIKKYGIGLVLPGGFHMARLQRAGYLITAKNLDELGKKIGVNAENLKETVRHYNEMAKSGKDDDFGRGTSPMNRFNGDSKVQPNPCLRPLNDGPYFAVAVSPADLASSAGLHCDKYGRVLDDGGQPIEGLFACGNDATSIFRGTYPGPGTTLGPAIVFGWRIAKYIAGTLDKSKT